MSHFFEGDVFTGADGAFNFSTTIKADVQDDFTINAGMAGGMIAVDLEAYVEGAQRMHYRSAVAAIFAKQQTFVGIANSLVDDMRYDVDLSGLKQTSYFGILQPDDKVTKKAFEEVDGMIVEVLQRSEGGSWRVVESLPAVRQGNAYVAYTYDKPESSAGERFLRFRSDGPALANRILVRTPVVSVNSVNGNPVNYQSVAVARVEQAMGVGSISAKLPDRVFRFPFILKDADLDIVGGEVRVRGEVGIGTGEKLVLFTIAQFEARFALTAVNHEGAPFATVNPRFFTVRSAK